MKIYCAGIGGIGLSAYAGLQQANGHEVSGSDRAQSVVTDHLNTQGITVTFDQSGTGVPEDTDLFVYSAALPKDNPERLRATELGLIQRNYFEALGDLSNEYTMIAVCGTHGKSSTTSMAAKVLKDSELDTTMIVGTKVPDLDGHNWRKGTSKYFLLEACEYRRHFLTLKPDIVLMLNVDGDHFDAFESVEDYQLAYKEFLDLLPDDGVVITHMSDDDCARLALESGRTVIDADTQPQPELTVLGNHMKQNGKLVLALAEHLGLDAEQTKQSLHDFKGCWRRLEKKGEYNGVPVYDDYAHHPVEVVASLGALREAYANSRIICVYQPHMHDRTLKLYDEFAKAFESADLVLVPNVYDARHDVEKDMVDVDKFVVDVAAGSGCDCLNINSLDEAYEYVTSHAENGDVVVCMGAGDITDVAQKLTA